jgi:hypothetical protein
MISPNRTFKEVKWDETQTGRSPRVRPMFHTRTKPALSRQYTTDLTAGNNRSGS